MVLLHVYLWSNDCFHYKSKASSRCFGAKQMDGWKLVQQKAQHTWTSLPKNFQSIAHVQGVTILELKIWEIIDPGMIQILTHMTWESSFLSKFTSWSIILWFVHNFHWCCHLSAYETQYIALYWKRKHYQMDLMLYCRFVSQSWCGQLDHESQNLLSEDFLSPRSIDT